jgi:hypothetical protein
MNSYHTTLQGNSLMVGVERPKEEGFGDGSVGQMGRSSPGNVVRESPENSRGNCAKCGMVVLSSHARHKNDSGAYVHDACTK